MISQIPTIPNYIFIILIAADVTYITFLTTKGGLTDNRYSSWIKKLTQRGRLVVLMSGMLIFINILQEFNSQLKADRKDKELKISEEKRDSIISARVAELNKKDRSELYEGIANAFQKQNLKLDTVNKTIEKLKYSKSITNTISQADPIFMLDTNAVKIKRNYKPFLPKNKYNLVYEVSFTSHEAASTNFEIDCFTFVKSKDEQISNVSKVTDFIPKKFKLPKDGQWTIPFESSSHFKVAKILFVLRGTYTGIDGKKFYPINELYVYDIESKILGTGVDSYRDMLMKDL